MVIFITGTTAIVATAAATLSHWQYHAVIPLLSDRFLKDSVFRNTVETVLAYTFKKHTPGLTEHFQFPQCIFLYIRPVLREQLT